MVQIINVQISEARHEDVEYEARHENESEARLFNAKTPRGVRVADVSGV